MSSAETTREALLRAVAKFVTRASRVRGVTRIALIGSLITSKAEPKDADVLVSVGLGADIAALSALGRKFKGELQSRNLGVDIFLASADGKYLGRTCSYRECHPRVRCLGRHCGSGSHLCDDLQIVTLSAELVAEPPLELWPQRVARTSLPSDTERLLSEPPGSRAA